MEDESDYLILNSDTVKIRTFPLDSYFPNSNRPDYFYPTEEDKEYRLKCYSATWELRNDSLFLKHLTIGKKKIQISKILRTSKKYRNGFAFWFTDSITINSGRQVTVLRREFEKIFKFSKGHKSTELLNHYTIFKRSEYTEDWEKLISFIYENIDYSELDEPFEPARVYVRIASVTKEGKIDSVNVVRGWDKMRDEEAMRVIKLIPNWPVVHKNGKHFNEEWFIPVKFGNKVRPANNGL